MTTATRGRPWTPENLAYVRRARADGLPVAEMAAALGRSVSAVKDKLTRLGLNIRRVYRQGPWTEDEAATLDAMLARGERMADISRALDRSQSDLALFNANRRRAARAAAVLREAGGNGWTRPRGMTPEQVAWARETLLNAAGLPAAQLAEAELILGLSREPILYQDPEKGWRPRKSA